MVKMASKTPLIRKKNKQKSLLNSKKAKECTFEQWKSVLWADNEI